MIWSCAYTPSCSVVCVKLLSGRNGSATGRPLTGKRRSRLGAGPENCLAVYRTRDQSTPNSSVCSTSPVRTRPCSCVSAVHWLTHSGAKRAVRRSV
ncbi:hypothetical protein D3C72_1830830 [compost metagenome]